MGTRKLLLFGVLGFVGWWLWDRHQRQQNLLSSGSESLNLSVMPVRDWRVT